MWGISLVDLFLLVSFKGISADEANDDKDDDAEISISFRTPIETSIINIIIRTKHFF